MVQHVVYSVDFSADFIGGAVSVSMKRLTRRRSGVRAVL